MLLKIPQFPYPPLLLHPMLPPPLHGVNPRTAMGQQKWDKLRRQAYAKYGLCCWACERKDRLEAHECFHVDWHSGTCQFKGVVALCNWCHSFIHRGRLDMLVRQRQLSSRKRNAILKYGKSVLARTVILPRDTQFVVETFGLTLPEVISRRLSVPPYSRWRVLF